MEGKTLTGLEAEAEILKEMISEMWEEDPDNLQICVWLRKLASLRVRQQRYEEAAYIFQRLKKLFAEHFGADDLLVIDCLFWLGVVEHLKGNPGQAATILVSAFGMLSASNYSARVLRARILYAFARVAIDLSKFDEAEFTLHAAVNIMTGWLGSGLATAPDRLLAHDIIGLLGTVLAGNRKLAEAQFVKEMLSGDSCPDCRRQVENRQAA